MKNPQETPDDALVKCEIDGTQHPYEILTYLRSQGVTVEEYKAAHGADAPLVHPAVLTFLESATIYLDTDGTPWRLISEWDKLGFQAYGPVVPHPTTPRADPYYEFPAEVTRLLYFAFEANKRVLLVGPPGTGKSELARNMCAHLGWGFRRMNFNGQATPRTLFGSPRAGAHGETYFLYGALPRAMRAGECILFDEISFIDADMAAGLHEPMEVGGNLTLLENGGEVIEPHPNFRIIGTDNVGIQGDMTGMFHGTKPLNAAFIDRWSVQVRVDYLDQEAESKVLQKKVSGLPRQLADMMTSLAHQSRQQVDKAELLKPLTLRQLLDWAALAVQHRSVKVGWQNAVINKASEEDAIALGSLMNHAFPEVMRGD